MERGCNNDLELQFASPISLLDSPLLMHQEQFSRHTPAPGLAFFLLSERFHTTRGPPRREKLRFRPINECPCLQHCFLDTKIHANNDVLLVHRQLVDSKL
jgi:hypothetical protein